MPLRRPRRREPGGLVVFTIVAANYLGYARTLMDSVRAHHPDSVRVIVLCDEPVVEADPGDCAQLLPARALGLPGFPAMAFHYDVMELCTAVKPTAFLRLMERHPGAGVIYLDPDILVTAPLDHVTRALAEGRSLVLTPHITRPLQDGFRPDDLAILSSGVYNLGFAAFNPTDESRDFLRWWEARCRRDAVADIAQNKFTDQRWMDLAPCLVRDTLILRESTYNLAYWNLPHRTVTHVGGTTLVDGETLRFVHFSGVDPADPTSFSRHQDRYTADTVGALRPLLDAYVARVQANGWSRFRDIPYAYRSFAGGRAVRPLMRRAFHRDESSYPADPFAGNGEAFDAPEPSLAALGPPAVTRLMVELWHQRRDLQAAFDLRAAAGREVFLAWFADGGAISAGLDEEAAVAARALLAGRATPRPEDAPWPPQTGARFAGTRHEVDTWLGEAVPLSLPPDEAVPVPRHLALAWESRPDLRRHFPNRTRAELEGFLLWALTHGTWEGAFDPALAEAALSPWLDAEAAPGEADQAPATRLAALLAPAYDGAFPALVRSWPSGQAARAAMALWVLHVAHVRHRWPAGLTGRLCAWAGQRPAGMRHGAPVVNLFHAAWMLRADVRALCDLRTVEGQVRLIAWMVNHGMREFGLPLAAVPEEVFAFLDQPIGEEGAFRRFHALCWAGRDELKARFDIATAEGRRGLVRALAEGRGDEWDSAHWLDRMAPPARPAVSPPQKVRVLLTGQTGIASGRGEDVRMTAAALQTQGMPFLLLDRESGRFAAPDGDEVPPPGRFSVNILHMNAETALPDHMFLRRCGAEAAHVIGYWAWELERLPEEQLGAFAFCDEIWASSRFAYECFRSTSPRPVRLMPMAVDLPAPDPALTRAALGLPADAFLFHFGFDFRSYTSRKNPEAAIAAFRAAFPRGDEPAALLVKTLAGTEHRTRLDALLARAGGDPRIIVRDREFSRQEQASLLALCDAYVSLHRSEGFGRGPAEAMLMGKPVIATGWSGNMDYMDAENALPVEYRLVPVVEGAYPGWRGQCWAEPSIAHAAALMRRLVADPAQARAIGARARAHMRAHFSAEAAGARYAARLAELAGEKPPVVARRRRRAPALV